MDIDVVLTILKSPATLGGVLAFAAYIVWSLPGPPIPRGVVSIGLVGISLVSIDIARQHYEAAGINHWPASGNILSAYCCGCLAMMIALCLTGSRWSTITRR
jgi:hypothetical protein